jgi:hypothetical protein
MVVEQPADQGALANAAGAAHDYWPLAMLL